MSDEETFKLGQTLGLTWDQFDYPGFVEGSIGADVFCVSLGEFGEDGENLWQKTSDDTEVSVNLVSGVVTVSVEIPAAITGALELKRLYKIEAWVVTNTGKRWPLDDILCKFIKPRTTFS